MMSDNGTERYDVPILYIMECCDLQSRINGANPITPRYPEGTMNLFLRRHKLLYNSKLQ
jgi:hypothetical protein